jgi:3-dehydroquinate synthase
MALDTRYSVECGLLPAESEERVRFLLDHLGFRLWHPALDGKTADGRHAILDGLREFREHLGGELTITLLSGIGTAVEVHEIDEALMLRAIGVLKERAQS